MNVLNDIINENIYTVVHIKEDENLVIGKCKDIKSAIQLINVYLRGKNIKVQRYIVTEKDNYTKLKNGEETFHLYKI